MDILESHTTFRCTSSEAAGDSRLPSIRRSFGDGTVLKDYPLSGVAAAEQTSSSTAMAFSVRGYPMKGRLLEMTLSMRFPRNSLDLK